MPLEFNDPRVTWFQDRNSARLYLDGSYFVALNTFATPQPIGFRWRAPVASAPGSHPVRRLPPGAPTITRLANGTTTAITPQRAPGGYLVLPVQTEPGHDTITYGSGPAAVQFRVWYLRGRITPRTSGAPSPGNTAWPAATNVLSLGAPNSIRQLGHGICSTDIGDASTGSLMARRYYGAIEFEGTIEPPDAPGAFCFARYKVDQTITPPPAPSATPGSPVGPGEDSSPAQYQVMDPRPARGRVYDTDGPGSVFAFFQRRGATEEYQAHFTQRLVVGDNRSFFAPARVILAQISWEYAAKYEVTMNGDQFMAPQIQPFSGYTPRLG